MGDGYRRERGRNERGVLIINIIVSVSEVMVHVPVTAQVSTHIKRIRVEN